VGGGDDAAVIAPRRLAYATAGRLDTFCFRGAQIDAYGNVNNTVIGPYEAPRVRLPGGGGMSDLGGIAANVLL